MNKKKHHWFKTISSKKNTTEVKSEFDDFNKLKVSVQEAIDKCNKEKKRLLSETDTIQKWIGDVISSVYYVPTTFYYKELENFEEIKKLEQNSTVSEILTNKCETILAGYISQLKLRLTKIQVCESLIEKYIQTQISIKLFIDQKKATIEEDKKSQSLDKHIERINLLQNSSLNDLATDAENKENTELALAFFQEELSIHKDLIAQIDQIISDISNKKES